MMNPELSKMFAYIEQKLVPADLRALGWRYIDPPTKFSHEMWDYFRALIGEHEHQLLIYSEGEAPDAFKWKRGQFVVSPQGMKNLADKERAARLSRPIERRQP
jgi:hypothetical protein